MILQLLLNFNLNGITPSGGGRKILNVVHVTLYDSI